MGQKKTIVATASLAGCFGCHMSLLDIDERILSLIDLVDFDKSPINDIKKFTEYCDIGIIEGSCCNSENISVLKDFRKNCRILISLGECAIMGGIPAMRNGIPIRECIEEAYLNGPSVKGHNPEMILPNDPELPMLLDKVYPCHDIVKIDYFLPGCPPSADLIYSALVALITGNEMKLPYEVIKYD
jgi:NAD-reducing hydrogenase small subunit